MSFWQNAVLGGRARVSPLCPGTSDLDLLSATLGRESPRSDGMLELAVAWLRGIPINPIEVVIERHLIERAIVDEHEIPPG